jgi:hypothetical protein
MSLTYIARGQTCRGPNGQRVRGEGEIGILKVRMARDQHTKEPWGAEWTGQVLLIPVEIRAGVGFAEWNQQRALKEVA